MKRIKLRFTDDLEVEFVDREQGIKQIYELAERGTRFPLVVYGPEGCGKSAWMRQAAEILRELDFDVIYVNPLERELLAEVRVEDIKKRLFDIVSVVAPDTWVRAVEALVALSRELIKMGRDRLAILVDEAFYVIGTGRESALYVKGLLGLIEYPPKSYDKIVVIVATSEGLSRREIGRHLWAELRSMWNMPENGFRDLYSRVPGDKPAFDEIWRVTGGNPRLLSRLYREKWSAENVLRDMINEKRIEFFIASLGFEERELLARAVDDPDTLMSREGVSLVNRLVELNLVIDSLPRRDARAWIDASPPEKDLELGIGEYIAWQTPLHREIVRRILEKTR